MPGGIAPKKSLGQHFLRSPEVLRKILAAAALAPGETVLEVGAGDGTLTAPLAAAGARVVAIETDRRCAARLRERFPAGGPVELIEADVLRLDLETLRVRAPLACVSNLPYNIATAVLDRLLEARGMFSRLVLMFQREVARRLLAGPGDPAYGSLSVATRYRAEGALVCAVPRGAFSPPPAVESAVVRLVPRAERLLPPEQERVFDVLLRGGFSHRRKTFLNALARSGAAFDPAAVAAGLAELGLGPLARAEEIGLEGYLTLARRLAPPRQH
jgi:16S rRNA (adenine1518-N6/adenine1519-N6)-dimethyltransferase